MIEFFPQGRRIFATLLFAFGTLLQFACSSLPDARRLQLERGEIAYLNVDGLRPTVVFQSGLGDGMSPWAAVLDRLPKNRARFAYDRPGYGSSTSATDARDPCSIAAELRAALKRAKLEPPYLLVGHSIGGLYQYAFAKLFPDDVAGLILLDATHPNHWPRLQVDDPFAAGLIRTLRLTAFSSVMRAEFDAQEQCLQRLESLAPLAKPTRILTRSRFDLIERGAFETMVRSLQLDWLRLTGARAIEPVEGTGHYLQRDNPAAVAQVIETFAVEVGTR